CLVGAVEGVKLLSTILLGVAAAGAPELRKPPFAFEWIELEQAQAAPFFLGMTRLLERRDRDSACWGRDPDPLIAHDKAAAEAFERLACITPAGLIRAPFAALGAAIDPRDVLSHSPQQYARRRFRRFDPRREHWWKVGTDCLSGAKTHVPAELV